MYRHLSCRVLLCALLSLVGCTESLHRSEPPGGMPPSAARVDSSTRAYPLFIVEEAYNGKVQVDTITSVAHVRVRSPDMAAGDTLKVYWSGVISESTATQTATGSNPLEFELPVSWLEANIGRTVDLYYTYKINGVGESLRSASLPVQVLESASVFSMDGVVDNTLNLSAVGSTAAVRVRYPGMTPQDTVKVYWVGAYSHSTVTQTAAGTAPLAFELPKAWLQESQDTTATLYYTYKVGGVGTTIRSDKYQCVDCVRDLRAGSARCRGIEQAVHGHSQRLQWQGGLLLQRCLHAHDRCQYSLSRVGPQPHIDHDWRCILFLLAKRSWYSTVHR